MTRRPPAPRTRARALTGAILAVAATAIALAAAAGCVKKPAVCLADATLRSYHDAPGLAIPKEEWDKCATLAQAANAKKPSAAVEAKQRFCAGKAALAAGDADGAEKRFREAAALDPLWALPWHALGLVLMDRGEFPKAAEALERACELDPQWATPLSDLGVAYHHLGKDEEALEAFDAAVELDPSAAFLHANRGSVLTDLGRLDEAIASHLKAINLEPHSPVLYANLAVALEEAGDLQNLLWAWEKLGDLAPEGQKAPVALKKAAVLEKMGRPDEALAELKKALALAPGSAAVVKKAKAFYLGHGMVAPLVELIAGGAAPGCAACAGELYDLGNLLVKEGNLDGAKEAYEAAVAIRPEWAEARHNLGVVCNRLHHHAKAVEHFATALALKPGDPETLFTMASSLFKLGKAAEALAALDKVLAAMKDFAPAHALAAEILRWQGKLKEADARSATALALAPQSCFIAARRAVVLAAMKKKGAARKLLAPFADAPCPAWRAASAGILVGEKRHGEALALLATALEEDPSLTEALALSALALAGQGKQEEAKAALGKAICQEAWIGGDARFAPLAAKLGISPTCD